MDVGVEGHLVQGHVDAVALELLERIGKDGLLSHQRLRGALQVNPLLLQLIGSGMKFVQASPQVIDGAAENRTKEEKEQPQHHNLVVLH